MWTLLSNIVAIYLQPLA